MLRKGIWRCEVGGFDGAKMARVFDRVWFPLLVESGGGDWLLGTVIFLVRDMVILGNTLGEDQRVRYFLGFPKHDWCRDDRDWIHDDLSFSQR